MLRPADLSGFGGGGGRPPVNIQVNFVPGEVNAFKDSRDLAKETNVELEKGNALLRERQRISGPGSSIPGMPQGGGISFGGRPATPGPGVLGQDTSSIDRMIADAQARRAGATRPIMAELVPHAAGGVGGGGFMSALASPSPALLGGLAAGAAAVGLAFHNLAMEVPNLRGALQDWEADLAARVSRQLSPEGTAGQIGSALSRQAGRVPIIGGPLSFGIGASTALAGGAWNYLTEADEVVRTQDNLARAEQRALFNQVQQRRLDARFSIGLSTNLAGAGAGGIGVGGLGQNVLANSQQRRFLEGALSATAGNDPQAGFQLQGNDRADALMRLRDIRLEEVDLARQAHTEGMRAWEAQLDIEKQVLALRQQEKDAVEQSTKKQIEGLAGLSTSELRRAESAFRSAQDGSVTRREAQILQQTGFGDLGAVQSFTQDRVRSNAPQIFARLQQALTQSREAEDRQTEAMADFLTQMNEVRESGKKVIQEIAAEAVKVAKELLEQAKQSKNDAVDESTAQTKVQGKQVLRAPGFSGSR